MTLLGHEAELHNHSLKLLASKNTQLPIPEELKWKYATKEKLQDKFVRNVEEISNATQGVLQNDETLWVYILRLQRL